MIGKLKCYLGFHEWSYHRQVNGMYPGHLRRLCYRCDLRQVEAYDMMYGETYWVATND